MIKFAIVSPNGLTIEAAGFAAELPAGAVPLPLSFDLSAVLRSYFAAGVLTPRPEVASPTLTPEGVRLGDYPSGTRIEIVDHEAGEFLAEAVIPDGVSFVDLEISDAGVYQFDIDPPFPYMPAVFNLEVSA